MPELANKTTERAHKSDSHALAEQTPGGEAPVALVDSAPVAAAGDATQRHASLLGDARVGRMSVGQRAGLVRQLQRGYGNGHVARVMAKAHSNGITIQRKECPPEPAEPAPIAPEQDPRFQNVTQKANTVATKEKQHASAQSKATESEAAAAGPANDISSQAAAAQVGKMQQQPPGEFDKKSFVAALKEAISKIAPKNNEDAEKFKGSGRTAEMRDKVRGRVDQSKDKAQKGIQNTTTEAPDASKAKPKPVTPMPAEQPGAPPAGIGAASAMPQPKPAEQVSLEHGPCSVEQQMAEADVTDEQLKKSNEPEFIKAAESKQQAEAHAQTAPQEFREQEQAALQQSQGEASADSAQSMQGMHGERAAVLASVQSGKVDAKGENEGKRGEIAGKIEAIYNKTKHDVTDILDGLDAKVTGEFDRGEQAARAAFEDEVDTNTFWYKLKRYGSNPALWLLDKLKTNPELDKIVDTAVKNYLAKMDVVIDKVAETVSGELKRAKDRIALGRAEIAAFVASQPTELRQIAQEAAEEFSGKFDELDQQVSAKRDGLVQSLAQRYADARDAVNQRATAMKEENKGLVNKAVEAVEGVIETIKKLKDMLMGVLAKAASVIDKIIKDPIGFLGNLLSGVKQGLMKFVDNIGTHLKKGLMTWLFGEMAEAGIQLPASFDLKGILTLVLQILGLTWESIRAQAVKILGPKVVGYLEGAFQIFMVIREQGIGGLWEFIKDQIGDLKTMVLDGIKDMVISQVIQAGIQWLIGVLGGPAGALIKAAMAIYTVVMWFVNNGSRLMGLVNAVLDSVSAIANGALGQAASMVEGALASAVPVAIGFLASLLGLGNLGQKIKGIIETVQAPVKKAVGWVLGKAKGFAQKIKGKVKKGGAYLKAKAKQGAAWAKKKLKQGVAYVKAKAKQGAAWAKKKLKQGGAWIKGKAKAAGAWVKDKYKKGKAWVNKKLGRDKDPGTRLEKGVNAGVAAVNKFEGKKVGAAALKPILWGIRSWYNLGVLEPVNDNGFWAVRGEIQRITVRTNVEVPREGLEIDSKTTKKGQKKVQNLYNNRNDAMNWARKQMGQDTKRVYDDSGKWIGWEDTKGNKVYWGHGDWGKGVGISTYPHLNYDINGVTGHLYLADKIKNRGMWDDFAKEFKL